MSSPDSRQHPTPPRPVPADVGRAVAAALVAGGSAAALQGVVTEYVRALRMAGVPPERALKRVKDVVGVSIVTAALPTPSDRLASQVVEWFVAEYYRAGE